MRYPEAMLAPLIACDVALEGSSTRHSWVSGLCIGGVRRCVGCRVGVGAVVGSAAWDVRVP